MPLYDFQCDECNRVFDEYCSMGEIHAFTPRCPKCKGPSHRVYITPPNAYREMLPHFDKGMGVWIDSRDDRKRKMAEKGLVEADPSLADQAKVWLDEGRDAEADNRRRRKQANG